MPQDTSHAHDTHAGSATHSSTQTSRYWSAWRTANHDYFKDKLRPLSRNLSLVDLGAGALQFEDLFLAFQYTGVDFVEFPHVTVIADLTKDLPLESNSADIVTLSNTVEHIPNTEHLFAECYRILRPGGIIVGTIPFLMPLHQAPYDFNRYTNFQLSRFLSQAGFSQLDVTPLGSLTDAYNTIELKTFDEMFRAKGRHVSARLLLKMARAVRRLEMRLLRWMFRDRATHKVTEGFGFYGLK